MKKVLSLIFLFFLAGNTFGMDLDPFDGNGYGSSKFGLENSNKEMIIQKEELDKLRIQVPERSLLVIDTRIFDKVFYQSYQKKYTINKRFLDFLVNNKNKNFFCEKAIDVGIKLAKSLNADVLVGHLSYSQTSVVLYVGDKAKLSNLNQIDLYDRYNVTQYVINTISTGSLEEYPSDDEFSNFPDEYSNQLSNKEKLDNTEKQRKKIKKECKICLDKKDETYFIHLACCNHAYCQLCLENAVDLAIKLKYKVKCPNCRKRIKDQDVRKITNNNQSKIDLLADIMFHRWSIRQKNIKQCPTPDCSYAFIDDQKCEQTTTCPKCFQKYCSRCLLKHSDKLTCKQANNERKANDVKALDDSTKKWLDENTRQCPKCNTRIQRNSGCSHMTCEVCRYGFCWNCNGDHCHLRFECIIPKLAKQEKVEFFHIEQYDHNEKNNGVVYIEFNIKGLPEDFIKNLGRLLRNPDTMYMYRGRKLCDLILKFDETYERNRSRDRIWRKLVVDKSVNKEDVEAILNLGCGIHARSLMKQNADRPNKK